MSHVTRCHTSHDVTRHTGKQGAFSPLAPCSQHDNPSLLVAHPVTAVHLYLAHLFHQMVFRQAGNPLPGSRFIVKLEAAHGILHRKLLGQPLKSIVGLLAVLHVGGDCRSISICSCQLQLLREICWRNCVGLCPVVFLNNLVKCCGY